MCKDNHFLFNRKPGTCVSCQGESDCFLEHKKVFSIYPFCSKCEEKELYNKHVFNIIRK